MTEREADWLREEQASRIWEDLISKNENFFDLRLNQLLKRVAQLRRQGKEKSVETEMLTTMQAEQFLGFTLTRKFLLSKIFSGRALAMEEFSKSGRALSWSIWVSCLWDDGSVNERRRLSIWNRSQIKWLDSCIRGELSQKNRNILQWKGHIFLDYDKCNLSLWGEPMI